MEVMDDQKVGEELREKSAGKCWVSTAEGRESILMKSGMVNLSLQAQISETGRWKRWKLKKEGLHLAY